MADDAASNGFDMELSAFLGNKPLKKDENNIEVIVPDMAQLHNTIDIDSNVPVSVSNVNMWDLSTGQQLSSTLQKPIQIVQPTPKSSLVSIQPRAGSTVPSAVFPVNMPSQTTLVPVIVTSSMASTFNSITQQQAPPLMQQNVNIMNINLSAAPTSGVANNSSGPTMVVAGLQQSQIANAVSSTNIGTMSTSSNSGGAFIQLPDGRIYKIQAPQFALLNGGNVQTIQLNACSSLAAPQQPMHQVVRLASTPVSTSVTIPTMVNNLNLSGQPLLRPKPPSTAVSEPQTLKIVAPCQLSQGQGQQLVVNSGATSNGQRVECSLPGARQVTLIDDKVHIVTRSGRKLIMEQQGFNIFQNIHMKLEELTRTTNMTPEVKKDIEKMRDIEAAVLRRYVIRSENPAGVSSEGLSAAATPGVVGLAQSAAQFASSSQHTAVNSSEQTEHLPMESLEKRALRIVGYAAGETIDLTATDGGSGNGSGGSKPQVACTPERLILIQPKAKPEPKMLVEFRINQRKYLLRVTQSQKHQLEQLLFQSTPEEQARVLQSITEHQNNASEAISNNSTAATSSTLIQASSHHQVGAAAAVNTVARQLTASQLQSLMIGSASAAATTLSLSAHSQTVASSSVAPLIQLQSTSSALTTIPTSHVTAQLKIQQQNVTTTPMTTTTSTTSAIPAQLPPPTITRTLTLQDVSRINIHRQLALEQRQVIQQATRKPFSSHHEAVASLMKWHVFQDREHLPEAEERLDEVENEAAAALVRRKDRLTRCVFALSQRDAISSGTTSEDLFLCTAAALELDKSLFLSEKESAATRPHRFVPLLFDSVGNAIPALDEMPPEISELEAETSCKSSDASSADLITHNDSSATIPASSGEDIWAVVLRDGSSTAKRSANANLESAVPCKLRRLHDSGSTAATNGEDPDLAAAIASIL